MAVDRFEGWTIDEAIERSVEPDLIAERNRAAELLDSTPSPGRRVVCYSLSDPYARPRFFKGQEQLLFAERSAALANASKRIISALSCHLIAGTFVACGRRGSVVAERIEIPASAWSSLSVINPTKSIIRERMPPKESIYDVRIFPRLKSPFRAETASILSGMSLVEAFKRFVFEDPEIAILGKAAIAVAPEFTRVVNGRRCSPHGIEFWPLEPSETMAGFLIVDPIQAKGWGQNDPPEVLVAARAIKDRFNALLSFLCRNELVAKGVPTRANENLISHAVWSHTKFYLDLRAGDVLREIPGSPKEWELEPEWQAVTLEVAPPFHMKPLEYDPQRSGTAEITARKPSKAEKQATNRAAVFKKAVAIMEDIIKASPEVRTHSVKEMVTAAQAKLRISGKDAVRAREKAIDNLDAPAWRHPGAPKRSKRP